LRILNHATYPRIDVNHVIAPPYYFIGCSASNWQRYSTDKMLRRPAANAVPTATALCSRLVSSSSYSSSSVPDYQAVVIGAGVVGLAVARLLALRLPPGEVLVVDAAGGPGQGNSSRNSEVIHAGIYYPAGSAKARTCVAGRSALYAFCKEYRVPHQRVGKLIVATSKDELPGLLRLRERAEANGVRDLELLSGAQARAAEPALRCEAALLSPSTGIIDSHAYMGELLRQLEDRGGTLALNSEVVGVSRLGPPHILQVRDKRGGGGVEVSAAAVVNAAGVHAPVLAQILAGTGTGIAVPEGRLVKGNYFSLRGAAPFSRLVGWQRFFSQLLLL
jgi:L-2-hydroxyglutarate oxidase LhgO